MVTNKVRTKDNKVDRGRIENSQYWLDVVLILSHRDALPIQKVIKIIIMHIKKKLHPSH